VRIAALDGLILPHQRRRGFSHAGLARGHYTSAVGLPGKAADRTSRENLRKTPGTEVEVKLRVADRQAILRRFRRLKLQAARGYTR
jgi:hypothetical protein